MKVLTNAGSEIGSMS
jgi:WD40 repeat protein